MRRRSFTLALALCLSSPAAFAHDEHHDVSKVNGSVHAEAGQTYGDLDTVNGSIHVDAGARADEVSTVNGAIRLDDQAAVASASTVNGSITAGQNVRIAGDVETVNGGIKVSFHSQVGGDIATVNGSVLVQQTQVQGLVSTVSGDITIGAQSVAHGGVKVEKPSGKWNFGWGKPRIPRIVIGPDARVEGDMVFEREVELFVHASAKVGRISGATAQGYTDTLPERRE
jgi:hypothetical protein